MQERREEPAVSFANLLWLSTALFIWYLVTFVFLPVHAVRPGLDESWRAFLPWAFEHHKQFGTEAIFTYGPWGFLLEPRGTASIYPWQILGRLVLAVAASLGIALLGVEWIRSAVPRWIWAAAIAIFADTAALIAVLLFLATMPSGVAIRGKKPVLILMAFATGLTACTKLTFLILAAALIALMVLRKDLRMLAAISVASFFVFWLAARQAVSNVPEFIRQAMEVSGGYATAMVHGSPGIGLLLALLVCGLPLLQLTAQIFPPITFEKLSRLGWLALCEFLIFHHGLTRSDPEHYAMAFLGEGMPIVILLLAMPGNASRVWTSSWKVVYRVAFACALAMALFSAGEALVKTSKIFVESLQLYPAYARNLFSGRMSADPITAGTDSVDVFPNDLSYAIEKGLPLINRPVIQAYSSYTRKLCEKNAAFLEGGNAPARIYFRPSAIDNRYPTTEDSLAWRSLMTHYTPDSFADECLVLKHRERPIGYELKPILDRIVYTDEFVDLPSAPGGLIWAEIKVHRTDKLLDLLYRKEKLVLQVVTARRSLDFTFLDENGAIGFLLSPYVNSPAAMLEVFEPNADRFYAERVRRILLHRSTAASLGFGRDVAIRLYALVIKCQAQDLPGQLTMDLGRTLRVERSTGSEGFSPALALKDGKFKLVAGSPSSGSIALPARGSLRYRYGIEATSAGCSGGVSFRILLGGGTKERRLLWEDTHSFADAKEWSAETEVKLPAESGQQNLYFETRSAEQSCGNERAYWSDLRLEP